METKVCTKCKVEKNIIFFSKCAKFKDGLQKWCKECKKQHYNLNKDYILKRQKIYKENNREFVLERKRQYHHNNKEKISKKAKINYQKNKKNRLEKASNYRVQNKERINLYKKTEKCKESNKKSGIKTREKLTDGIVAGTIRNRWGLNAAELPTSKILPEIIQFERQLLKFNRTIKNIENGKSESKN